MHSHSGFLNIELTLQKKMRKAKVGRGESCAWSRVLLRVRYWANSLTVRMIIHASFHHVEESFLFSSESYILL